MRNKKFLFYQVSILFLWIGLIYMIFMSSIRSIVSPITQSQKDFILFYFPQGWGFFTKNPRDEVLVDIYKIDKNKLNLITISNTSSLNLFGFSRSSRFVGAECSKLLTLIDEKGWRSVPNWNLSKKYHFDKFEVNKSNIKLKYIKRGEYLIVKHKLIPWAWAVHNQNQFKTFWIKRISI